MSTHLDHRQAGYKLLRHHGLEIGAFHQPAQLSSRCTVEYCDAHSREEMVKFFPELRLPAESLVKVDYICDLDTQGLSIFQPAQFDFVILNHVIEHIANPIKIVAELFRITKSKGHVVISAPDKNFTFDKSRALTTYEHLLKEYQENVTTVTDVHYIDFLWAVRPEAFQESQVEFQRKLNEVKTRREHVHVWDSETFDNFLSQCLKLCKITAKRVFLSRGEQNQFEYFSVWKKL